MTLEPRMLETFAAVAESMIEAPDGLAASDLRLTQRLVTDLYDMLPHDGARSDLRQLLRLLGSGPGGMFLHGNGRPFEELNSEDRERALRRMARHPVGLVRLGFKGLKSLVSLLWLNPPGEDADDWPPWQAMSYPGPATPDPAAPSPVEVSTIDADASWDADVVVVGSGAGGGVAAAILAEAGLDVVVLEKGGDHREGDFPRVETAALQALYQDGGMGTTRNGGLVLLAGATLGGGTVVNYTSSFRLPEHVRAEWDRESGYPGLFTGQEFDSAMATTAEGFGVNLANSDPAGIRDLILERGLRTLGWHADTLPRNAEGCSPEICGSCGFGCPVGSKRSTLRTWLPRASAAGARVIARAAVSQVLIDRGRAEGVVADVGGHLLTVRAPVVVLAAGALNTPALLLRSAVRGPAVGRFLRLHPATALWARFDEVVEPWTGMLQARFSNEFADLDGKGYGFRLEAAPIHPLFAGLAFGWDGGRGFYEDLVSLRHISPVGILLRDQARGRVRLRQSGRPEWEYHMPLADRQHMVTAFEKAAEVAAASGAVEVMAPTLAPIRWSPGDGGSAKELADSVRRYGVGANRVVYGSFHQMGSARIGKDRRRAVVDADGQTHGVDGLYVMDGSTFPTASGVNPMLAIASVAHLLASKLAARLS